MDDMMLLIDASADSRTKIGYGACLILPAAGVAKGDSPAQVRTRRFQPTTAAKLEVQTLLWALGELPELGCRVKIYTDAQSLIGLPGRRERLERQRYRTAQRRLHNHAELYQEFYRLTDQFACTWIKLAGHRPANQQDELGRLFALVDRASRRALRQACR